MKTTKYLTTIAIASFANFVVAQPTDLPSPLRNGVSTDTNGIVTFPTNFGAANYKNVFAAADEFQMPHMWVGMVADNATFLSTLNTNTIKRPITTNYGGNNLFAWNLVYVDGIPPTYDRTTGNYIAGPGDDNAPLNSKSQGYFEGNHGYHMMLVTASGGHGLTPADYGKTWTHTGVYYALWRTNSPTLALFVQKPYVLSGIVTNYTRTMPAGASGTLTAAVDVAYSTTAGPANISWTSANASSTYTPVNNNVVRTMEVSDVPLDPSKEYIARQAKFTCTRNIWAPWKWYTNCTYNVGTLVNPTTLPTWLTRTETIYTYPWGTVLEDEVTCVDDGETPAANQALDLYRCGMGLQSAVLLTGTSFGLTNLWYWLPGVSGDTVDFGTPLMYTNLASMITAPSNTWQSLTIPPSWAVQFAQQQLADPPTLDATNYSYNFAFGYDPTYEDVANSVRAVRCQASAWGVWATSNRKIYPVAHSGADVGIYVGPGQSVKSRVWRNYSAPNTDGWLVKEFVYCRDYWLIYLGWTSTPNRKYCTLPAYLQRGQSVTLVQAKNATLISSKTDSTGVLINGTGSPGYCILRVGI